MASKPPTYQTQPTDAPIWVSEPFRVFFPLGILAGTLGLLLWPIHYAGWMANYPALQHPRLMILGFGAAFVTGFLGTAWPRFLESQALRTWEFWALVASWVTAQTLYLAGDIRGGDLATCWLAVLLLIFLGRRLRFGAGADLPPPGFALAFLSLFLLAGVTLTWILFPMGVVSVQAYKMTQLLAYQGFLLLPLLGVGSYLFGRFFQVPGKRPSTKPPRHRALAVWSMAAIVLLSFVIEAGGGVRSGNLLRLLGLLVWAFGAVPGLWKTKAPNTRAWALRIGLGLIALTYICQAIWPMDQFAWKHVLFLGGFSLVMLLTSDRVILGHCADPTTVPPRSKAWRWIVWLTLITLATRVTADLVPTTRVSHHIYAALTLIAIFGIWIGLHGKHLRRTAPESKPTPPSSVPRDQRSTRER